MDEGSSPCARGPSGSTVGSLAPAHLTTCSDIDLMSANADGRFVHKDGTPYPGQ